MFPLLQQKVLPSYLPMDAEGVEAEAAEGDQQSCQHYPQRHLEREIQLRVGPAMVESQFCWDGDRDLEPFFSGGRGLWPRTWPGRARAGPRVHLHEQVRFGL